LENNSSVHGSSIHLILHTFHQGTTSSAWKQRQGLYPLAATTSNFHISITLTESFSLCKHSSMKSKSFSNLLTEKKRRMDKTETQHYRTTTRESRLAAMPFSETKIKIEY
jgi:hypothetical protein